MTDDNQTPVEETSAAAVEADTEASAGTSQCAKAATVFKLVLLAAVAAVVGTLVTANWFTRSFSLVVVNMELKAGIVILVSVALGFVLGVVFLWSAVTKD